MDLPPQVSDRYAFERMLGRGGMATVWLVRDLRYDRPAALKLFDPVVANTVGAERFLREITLAARLQHPHIVPVYDSGEQGGRLGFTMPYVEGDSLRDRLRRDGRLPADEAVRIASQSARALQYAHEHGVVHRDIKPENILLTSDGSTLVADFGIARPAEPGGREHLTSTGVIVGTPLYMSPEQASGSEPVDARSDIYSLGCTLYEMLAGEPPFQGPSAYAVLMKHLTAAPTLVGGVADAIPPRLRPVIARALAKTPDERFATAAELERALGDAVAGRPAGPGRPLVAVGTGVALVALLAVLIARGTVGLDGPDRGADGGRGSAVASGFERKLSQLTFGEGVEEWPAWSPDGARLAYVSEVDGFRQLFLREVGTGRQRRLTEGLRDDIQPAWSPDGSRLAFVRASTASGKLEPSDINGSYAEGGDVWVLDPASGEAAKLVDDAFGPAWSPDGRSIAFDAPWAGPRRIWIADAAGRNPRQATSDSSEAVTHSHASWSPDGRHLVYRREDRIASDIVTAEPGTGVSTHLTEDITLDLDPVWAPDGRRIYFASYRGGGLNIWRIPVDGEGRAAGPPQQLTTGAGDDVEPAIAPDGRRVAFAVRGINSDLWRLPLSPETGAVVGKAEPVLTTSRVESRGAWSPDGRRIAFNSDRLGEMNIWVRELRGGEERRITTGAGGDYQPAWMPGGERLVFFSARGGNTDIWLVSLADGALVRLTEDGALDTNPAPSPDGELIAFLSDRSGRTEVWVMRSDGSEQRRLTSIGAGGHFLRWTADGREIVFRAERGPEARASRVALADGTIIRLPEISSGGHMSFSPSQDLIMDVRGHRTLWVYPVDGRPARRVFEFADPDIRVDYPMWSPDGRWVLFDRAAPRGGDLWTLEGLE